MLIHFRASIDYSKNNPKKIATCLDRQQGINSDGLEVESFKVIVLESLV